MFKSLCATLVTSMLLCGGHAIAQETTEGILNADDNGLSLGEEVPQNQRQQQVGDTYIGAIEGDWALRCLKADEGKSDPCQLYQLLNDAVDNAVAETNINDYTDPVT